MNNISFWEKESFLGPYDFVILGGGIVGLSTALHLKKQQPEASVLVLERGTLPSGASTKNAGFACFGSPTELLDDLTKMSTEQVYGLVQKRYRGLQLLQETLGPEAIGLEPQGGYEVFRIGQENHFLNTVQSLPEFNTALREILPFSPVFREVSVEDYGFGMQGLCGIIRIEGEAQIHTGKMMKALWQKVLKAGVMILSGVCVTGFHEEGQQVSIQTLDHTNILGRKLCITMNGFTQSLIPELPVKPGRAQVLITKPIESLKLRGSFHYDAGYYYFRNVGNRILLGGGRNLDFAGEETMEMGNTPKIMDSLHLLLQEMILPGVLFEEDIRWSGIMGVGPEKNYILERISPNVCVGVRMGGMGVALGSLVGLELSELALISGN
jgi:glycine/D-amino acid oxidase-like deaminating enzyme